MALIDYFIAKPIQDFIGVFDDKFNQVFPKARILKPVIKPTAKGMRQPVESGKLVVDHVVIQPLQIDLTLMITGMENIENTYQSIYNYWYNHTLLTVQSKTSNYSNMYILEMPHEENPDYYDAVSMVLSLEQAFIASSTESKTKPKDPINTDTVDRGTQLPKNPNDSQSTIALDLFTRGG